MTTKDREGGVTAGRAIDRWVCRKCATGTCGMDVRVKSDYEHLFSCVRSAIVEK